MNKRFLLYVWSISILMLSNGCMKAQSGDLIYDHEPKGVMWEYTSTGCPGCGSWGKPKMDHLLTIIGDKVNHAAVHVRFGDPMENELTKTFYNNRPGRKYTPQFFLNEHACTTLTGQGFLDSTATFDKAVQFANEAYGASVPLLDGVVTKEGNQLKVKYGVQSNMGGLDGYNLAAYLLTSGLQYPQKGFRGSNPIHNNVIVSSADEQYGVPAQTTGNTFEREAIFDLSGLKGQPSVLVVLWRKDGTYHFSSNSLRLEVE